VITLHPIVGVLLGVVKRVRYEFFDHGLQSLNEIGNDLVWFAVRGECCGEEGAAHFDAAFGQEFFDVSVGQSISEVPADDELMASGGNWARTRRPEELEGGHQLGMYG
jgi:hypothetical protein